MIETLRLRLRSWREDHRDAFARMHSDREVMADQGGPIDCADSDAKFDRYVAALGPHYEVGWRFVRSAWGHGFATESARAALDYAFRHLRLDEIVSYTSADNRRSQAVMARINLERAPSRDFVAEHEGVGPWHGLVWVASRTHWMAMA